MTDRIGGENRPIPGVVVARVRSAAGDITRIGPALPRRLPDVAEPPSATPRWLAR